MTRIFSALLALAICLPPAAAQPAAQPAALDGYVSLERPFATVYAPTEDALIGAAEELAYAAFQFDRVFGEAPPKITVVLADSLAAFASLDLKAIEVEGRPLLPFVTQNGMSGSSNAAVVGGAVLLGDASGVRVASVLPDATLLVSPGDRITAVDDEPVASPDAARAALGAPGSDTRVDGIRGGEPFTVFFRVPDEDGPRARLASGGSSTALAARPLSHEAGHLFLRAYTRAHAPDAPSDGYGSPLPDWMDEGFATWCEIPSLVRRRDALLAQHPLPALDSLWTMRHPLVAAGIAQGVPASAGEAGRVRRLRIPASQAGALTEASLFYSHTSSFVRFLAATRGDRAFGRLVDAALAGTPARVLLTDDAASDEELRRGWREWIDSTRPDA